MKYEHIARLRAASPMLGTWLSIGSPVVAELAAESGFDWLLFDLEHGCGSESTLLSNLQAIKGTAVSGVVRVGAPHHDMIQRALDWGADAIMVPHISTAQEAEDCVQAMHYPPRGSRGVSRTVRAYNYGLNPPGAASNAPITPVFMAQIETVAAVNNVEAIAAVPGVDVLFVGPGDLSFDLSVQQEPLAGGEEECFRKVVAAAKAVGKPAGILVRNYEEIPLYTRLGFTLIAVDSDLAILRGGYLRMVNNWRTLHRSV